jgi:alkanesulfonate monooxygenase SsuD/methylene tetrahydromethanopterin reductase-like flavin-dependent oxidoreductase (luciferase family)
MPAALPALNLIAEPGRRRATLDIAREIERRGFAGISVSSSFGNMSQSVGLALATERIPFATAIAPIYAQSVDEFAQNAAYLHEVSGGRFQFGIGIAHAPAYVRMEAKPGKPLGDIRAFVEKFKSHTEYGPLPPVILATLRKRMIALSGEIAGGLVFANGSRAHMTESLGTLPGGEAQRPGFLYRQPHSHLHLRRRRRGKGGAAQDDGALLGNAELPKLLEGSRLPRRDERVGSGDRRGIHP